MTKIMFSLLVHEKPIVILDQVMNILKYNPTSSIVIHFNPAFVDDDNDMKLDALLRILYSFDNIYINTNRVRVCKDDIIQAHLSNFEFVKNQNFEYFYFIASNELFLKSGLANFIKDYDYGCECIKKDNWHYFDIMSKDPDLEKIKKLLNTNEYYYSQIEGSFYSKNIMSKIVSIINKCYDYKKDHYFYPRDEVYFSTIAINLFRDFNRFDGCLCRIKWQGKILFTSLKSINKIVNCKDYCFSVKRVDREINNYLRSYIRHNIAKTDVDFIKQYPYSFKKITLYKVYAFDLYYRFIYFFRDKIARLYRLLFNKK